MLIGIDYKGSRSTVEFDFRMRLAHDRCTMRDVDFRQKRTNFFR